MLGERAADALALIEKVLEEQQEGDR